MKYVTIPDCMDLEPPKVNGPLAHVLWLSGAIVLAMLASLWSMLRETPSGTVIPKRVIWTAIIGGLLSGAFTVALLLQVYDWQHPWAIIVVSIPAGFGAPLVLSAGVNALVTVISGIASAVERKKK